MQVNGRNPPIFEITEEDLTRVNGQWLRDDRGWWYQKGRRNLHVNGWQYINVQVVVSLTRRDI